MQAATPAPKAPTAKSKYTNKDGTKTITVPKSSSSTPPAQPSPTTTSSSKGGAPTNMGASPAPGQADSAPAVNKKKQKRRAKLAAKAAAAAEAAEAEDVHAPNGLPSPASTNSVPLPRAPATGSPEAKSRHHHQQPAPANHELSGESNNPEYWDDETESDEEHHLHSYNGGSVSGRLHANGSEVKSKKSKKKKKQKITSPVNVMANELERRSSGISREKIWNTSSQEERERIKQFWLGLGEDERKSLVKVEKDAVLKKMKEQQKHTCSCTVCGRKRTAIEEELEGLYDAYYEELESFANQPHHHPDGPPMLGNPTRRIDQMAGLVPPRGLPSTYSNHHPSRGRIVEHVDHDEDEEDDDIDEYSDEDDLEDDEDDEPEPEDLPQDTSHDAQDALSFFNFGQSLTVQGGILTVADDLLKNDGRKFIEMMEQLAERRMAREEDARDHYAGAYGHSVNGAPIPNSHNHPPPDDEEYDEEDEEEDDYESGEEEYDEEEDTMTEEQRMEEGRRMFQIFAARMFEQRVLTAYKEKVAKERQQKLLEELEDESRAESQRKAKKAKEAQKRKDKAAQKKQALAEEKARKEAEKAAEEAQRLADAQRRQDEAKAKAEEKRRKKELQKKAEEEERLRKEAERQRRAHEVKERQAEQERKAREAKEREKKLKHEQSVKEKEARELKERETRERREKHEKDKREKEQRAAQAKADRDAKEKQKQEEKAAQKAAALAVPVPTAPAKKHHAVSAVPALPQHPPANHPSPHISVATPVLPKAPTPMKPRSVSQEVTRSMSQASIPGSGPSQSVSPHNQTPLHNSPGQNGSLNKTPTTGPPGFGPHGTPTSPLHSGIKSPPGLGQAPYIAGMPPMGMHHPPGLPPMGPGFSPLHNPGFPLMGGNFRPPPNTSFEPGSLEIRNSPQVQPISRPTPIGRPASIVHGQRANDRFGFDEEINNHLGSSALLDDSDEPLGEPIPQRRSNTAAPGVRPFTAAPFPDAIFGSSPLNPGWGGPHLFSPPPGFGSTAWPPNPAFGGPPPGMRPAQPHSVAVRLMLCRACRELESNAADSRGYIDLSALTGHVESINTGETISESELLDMCETEGNPQNGGGSFDIRQDDATGKVSVRFDPSSPGARNVGAPGEIGSPISGGLFGGR
ncbi:hypothetical protein PG995_016171 [Apiospora arundinis]